ncbi:hypothetical protein BDZ45DRAFT_743354 [Acephala macrosclerotiorum]|nr:hypothetical protein BDZ45DRAFT_743354 [Acephala macrosclerotiorum]
MQRMQSNHESYASGSSFQMQVKDLRRWFIYCFRWVPLIFASEVVRGIADTSSTIYPNPECVPSACDGVLQQAWNGRGLRGKDDSSRSFPLNLTFEIKPHSDLFLLFSSSLQPKNLKHHISAFIARTTYRSSLAEHSVSYIARHALHHLNTNTTTIATDLRDHYLGLQLLLLRSYAVWKSSEPD